MMLNVKTCFFAAEHPDSFKRVDNEHPLDLYLGIDSMSRYTMLLITEHQPKKIDTSRYISVQTGLRGDKRFAISFSLVDNDYMDMFFWLCDDLIESSRTVNKQSTGTDFLTTRFNKWQYMLAKNPSGMLSKSEIKGLIGELIFMFRHLIPRYGSTTTLSSWTGPEMSHQDFVMADAWYEVKSINAGSDKVTINSIEQLDAGSPGELCTVYLDATSQNDPMGYSLNSLFKTILGELTSDAERQMLTNKLLTLGYFPRAEYDSHSFRFSGFARYSVSDKFPCIRRQLTPDSVVNVTYTLSLPAIHSFILEG